MRKGERGKQRMRGKEDERCAREREVNFIAVLEGIEKRDRKRERHRVE